MSHSGDDAQTLRSGMQDAQTGLGLVADGVTSLRARDAAGSARLQKGMGMVDDGVATMHDGLGAMGACRMDECGATGRMTEMDRGLADMKAGYALLTDGDPSNDTRGLDALENARAAMNTAMKGMSDSMSCMGHDGSMMGR
jgi:hypothetical protein